MTDVYPPEKRSAVMRRVKSSATKPELAVRRLVWSLGGRYRLNRADLPGKPDIVLTGRRLAIFVHGCFWHGHDCARGSRVPQANRDYWVGKVARNRERDEAARSELEARAWRVEVVWECGLKDGPALRERLTSLLDCRSPPERSDLTEPLLDPRLQGVADLAVGLQHDIPGADDQGRIMGRPVFDIHRPTP